MTDDGDEPITALTIAAAAGVATSLASTGLALSKGGPNLPKAKPPAPPPAVPPPPAPVPPAPTLTEADEGVARERRKRQTRFGVAETIIASPLGGGAGTPVGGGRTLLGGG